MCPRRSGAGGHAEQGADLESQQEREAGRGDGRGGAGGKVADLLALAEYRGLTVAHLDVLRRQARDRACTFVLKNPGRRAVAGTAFECASEAWSVR